MNAVDLKAMNLEVQENKLELRNIKDKRNR